MKRSSSITFRVSAARAAFEAFSGTRLPPPKGEKDGECNRTDCHNNPAVHFNRGTNKFYCTPCAKRINESAKQTGMEPLCDGFGG